MAPFFLAMASVCFGYAGYGMALKGWDRLERERRSIRLSRMMEGKRSRPSWSGPLDRAIDRIAGFKWLRMHLEGLSVLLKRADRIHPSPTRILSYQVIGGGAGMLCLGILSGSWILGAVAGGVGAAFPWLWIKEKAEKRENALLRELPNAMEVLSLCSEAGLSLEQGMDQYLANSRTGPLSAEIKNVLEQTRSGSGRKAALKNVAQKLQLTDFSLFSTSLIQAEKFGTGVAATLRQLARTLRDQQAQRAEKAIQELPVKLLFPLVFFIMPVTFLVIFGPVILQFLQP